MDIASKISRLLSYFPAPSELSEVPSSKWMTLFFAIFAARIVGKIVYRLWFHPLRHIPGPFLAKITSLYEFYYEVVKQGEASSHAADVLQPKYGPIVRLQPNRVRVLSPTGWSALHSVSTHILKDAEYNACFGCEGTSVGFIQPAEFRKRRKMILPMLSRESFGEVEPLLKSKVDELCSELLRNDRRNADGNMFMRNATAAVVTDFITQFLAGFDYDAIHRPNFSHTVSDLAAYLEVPSIRGFMPGLLAKMHKVPTWVLTPFVPEMAARVMIREELMRIIKRMRKDKEALQEKGNGSGKPEPVIGRLLDLLETDEEVLDESFVLFAASVNEVAWTLVTTLYHIAANPDVQATLFAELKATFPSKGESVAISKAERCEYLTAVIKESLRLDPPIPGILPRLSPTQTLTIDGIPIPPSTPIDSSTYPLSHNATIFPSPNSFLPDRWIGSDAKKLDKYLGAFGGGSRICLGREMAWGILSVVVGTLVRRFELEPSESLKAEGWKYVDVWSCGKRGDQGWFRVEERAD